MADAATVVELGCVLAGRALVVWVGVGCVVIVLDAGSEAVGADWTVLAVGSDVKVALGVSTPGS